MKKCASEIYGRIVSANTGDLISTRHQNRMDYSQTIADALTQQGYKKGVDYDIVFNWNTCTTYIKKLGPIGAYKEPVHDFRIGDIVYNSWGYDQTNIDYYQVVAKTAKTISLRKIKTCVKEYNAHQMTGWSVPANDNFCSDEILRKTPYLLFGEWRVNFDCGAGGKWDGHPMDFSCYA